ncbi:glyoxalase/bleomycin resistance protein/dioxygenase [Mycolicibacterium novocastrense]|uniref:Glyoxalase/bleomycin resistance protein/dioxygenase n=1 Tax=Mycolicibacterium novocastrense TaxID=59813 RepID=A0ABQ0KC71_MYCNV|nr:glyoxalase/bleomycin resistance protein/dioxygenase [Mycolicibacterium novocastrense]
MSVVPGPIRQIGYIVTDIDRAMASWLDLGVGPWFVMRNLPLRGVYRGAPCEISMTLGLANSGELQVELIQQDDDTPSIYTEFLAAKGPGYHQLAYWAEDSTPRWRRHVRRAGQSSGRVVRTSGRASPTSRRRTVRRRSSR